MTENALERTMLLAQKYLAQSRPVMVLGSGASCALGLPGMAALGEHLLEEVKTDDLSGDDQDAWRGFADSLGEHGLERALDRITPSQELTRRIVRSTWQCISNSDHEILERLVARRTSLALSEVFQHFTRTASSGIQVVTTNYDCLVEYACDAAGLRCETGMRFGHSIREIDMNHRRQLPGRRGTADGAARLEPTVCVWKVHGSLDWFARSSGDVVGLPRSNRIVDGLEPLVVTPGTSKYQRAYGEPFRTMMAGADDAMADAEAFLCIGYGFNDEHVQPKLLQRCRTRDTPIVVLARSLTEAARRELLDHAPRRYLVLESSGDATRAYSNDWPEGMDLPVPELWDLPVFYRRVLAAEGA